jgi:putative aldouronate transport system substrate-binding protein
MPIITFLPGDDYTRNEWTRGLKDALNVEVVTDWTTTQNGYYERLNLAIAANQIPDVFFCTPTQFKQLIEAGMVADLTDYIENNASDMVKNLMAASPSVTETAKVNGRLMGLPRYGYGDLWLLDSHTWIRNDWLVQSGLGAPKTIADLERIMDSFMAAHPGSYGIGLQRGLSEMYWLAPAFGALPYIWYERNGSLVYGHVQPEMRAVLEKFADWYRRGYIKRDFMSATEQEIVNDIAAGRLGVHIFQQWAGWQLTDAVRALGRDAYFVPYEHPSATGRPNIYPVGIDNNEYIVVNKNFNNIPAVLKSISYNTWVIMEAELQGALSSEQIGRYLGGEGNGRHTFLSLTLDDPYGNGAALVEWAHKVGLNNYQITEPPLTSEWLSQYEQAAPWWRNNDVTGYGRWIQQYNPANSSGWNALQIMKEGRYVPSRLTGPLPDDASGYDTASILFEGFTKIIVGEQPISYFDTIVADWRRSGGDVITRAVNRDYGR